MSSDFFSYRSFISYHPLLGLRSCVLSILLFSGLSFAEVPTPPERPERPCVGYETSTQKWGLTGAFELLPESGFCAKGSAIFASIPVYGSSPWQANQLPVWGTCCPVPSDALLDEHQFASEECPDGTVVTGTRQIGLEHQLRCTRVNPHRYALSEPRPGVLLSLSLGIVDKFHEDIHSQINQQNARISWNEIPPALRYALGRMERDRWGWYSCLAHDVRGILVARRGRPCSSLHYRSLLKREENSPLLRTVEIFPSCRAIAHPLSESPTCIP